MQYTLQAIPAGEAGTDTTVEKIADLVKAAIHRPGIRLITLGALNRYRAKSKNSLSQSRAIFRFVKKHVRYTRDPVSIETVADPEFTLRKTKAGDCDDMAAVIAAMNLSIGIPTRFRVIGSHPDRFRHVFAEVYIDGTWLPADPAECSQLGQRVQKYSAEKLYNFGGSPIMLSAAGKIGRQVSKRTLKAVAYRAALKVLKTNWANGLINRNDVVSYIRVIKEGNSPSRGTIVEPDVLAAIKDFLNWIDRNRSRSTKPVESIDGLSGLDGFLKSVWNGVKSATNSVVGIFKSDSPTVEPVYGSPDAPFQVVLPSEVNITPSLVTTETSPEAAQAGIASMFKNPVVLFAVAALGYMAFVKRR
ncbi:MAG: transglutaminase-like domain-containing protein [Planctomycetota bacterium]|jgi:hypothetical protein